MKPLLKYVLISALGGIVFYLVNSLMANTFYAKYFFYCAGMGALGGLIPAFLREAARSRVPLIHSWIMLIILIFALPLINRQSIVWIAMAHGYICYLLSEAYRKKLGKY